MAYVADLRRRAIVEFPAAANQQHYEVPAEFYDLCLGPAKKYSCGYWPPGVTSLEGAEVAALALVAERAGITNTPMRVLDLGCGWGSLTLFLAAAYPALAITAVSNSASQRAYIEAAAAARHLRNVTVITANVAEWEPAEATRFDRVVSVEMFEHVKNYDTLLARVATWLRPGGRLFVHIFAHKSTPFHYTTGWMAEHFFTGGQVRTTGATCTSTGTGTNRTIQI